VARQIGKFELADGGTVFLDEIGDLAPAVQSKVLRIIQERKFERIGGLQTLDVDVRVICATNRDLHAAIREGRFREDLFFRINVFPVEIPPLRSRKEDLEPLARFFVARFAKELGKGGATLSEDAWRALRAYDWPGNVRELENALERALILADGSVVGARDLQIGAGQEERFAVRSAFDLSGSLDEVAARAVGRVERAKILEALHDSSDRQAAAAKLGLSSRALTAKLKQYGLEES
jgi:transcriptional regulator with GAF, ATPase, and Fis domain